MPIKPIDLQTLFGQLGQVGRQQAAEKEGAAIQQSVLGATQQKKEDEAVRTVRRAEDDEAGVGAVKADEERTPQRRDSERKRDDADEAPPERETVKDPALGGHVDITG